VRDNFHLHTHALSRDEGEEWRTCNRRQPSTATIICCGIFRCCRCELSPLNKHGMGAYLRGLFLHPLFYQPYHAINAALTPDSSISRSIIELLSTAHFRVGNGDIALYFLYTIHADKCVWVTWRQLLRLARINDIGLRSAGSTAIRRGSNI